MRSSSRRAVGLVRSTGADRLVIAERRDDGIAVAPARECVEPGAGSGRFPPVVAFVSDMSVRHEHVELPLARGKALRLAMERHHETASRTSPESEICLAALDPERPHALMSVSADRGVVRRTVESIEQAGYRVRRLATPLSAIVGLLDACGALETDAESGATVIAHIGQDVASVGFVFEGALLRARVFRTPRGEHAADPDAIVPAIDPAYDERIIGEIGRSLLFFNHELQGRRVGRILVSSDLAGAESLLPLCRERFRVPVSATIDATELDVSAFTRCAGAATAPGVWLGAIAAAVVGVSARPDIDLRPRAAQVRSARRRSVALVSSVLVAGAIGMSLVTLAQIRTLRALTEELMVASAELDGVNADLESLESARRADRERRARVVFADRTRRPLASLEEALRALSLAARGDVRVETVEMAPWRPERARYDASAPADRGKAARSDTDGIVVIAGETAGPRVLTVSGRAFGGHAADAERSFETFLGRLRTSPVFATAVLRPIRIDSDTDTDATTDVASLSFEIRAPIEQ